MIYMYHIIHFVYVYNYPSEQEFLIRHKIDSSSTSRVSWNKNGWNNAVQN